MLNISVSDKGHLIKHNMVGIQVDSMIHLAESYSTTSHSGQSDQYDPRKTQKTKTDTFDMLLN